MIYIDEIKNLKLYKRQFLLPRNGIDKKHNNVVMLLTPNQESSKKIINHPLMKNKYYRCYWLEKDVSFYINNENNIEYIDHQQYIHESEEGEWNTYVNEGVFNYYKSKIIYNGYRNDVDRASKYINLNTIGELNKNLKAKIKFPISVTVFPKNPTISTDEKSIIVSTLLTDEKDFKYHCREEICTMLVKTINPDVKEVILEPIVMVLSGTYDEYNDLFNIENGIPYRYICEGVKSIISSDRGYKDLYDIIKKNDIKALTVNSTKTNPVLGKFVNEAKLDPLARLKRYITFSSRKGSAHKINTINNNIEKTVDTTVDNPEFKENNDIAKKDREKKEEENIINKIDVPNIDSEKQNVVQSTEEIYSPGLINDEYVFTEDYLQTAEGITYFMEASDANGKLRKILYRERLRTNKDVINIYDDIKNSCPDIKYTYLNLNRYKNMNLIVDLRFYNELFFKNNMYKLDKGIDLYFTLLSRMINNKKLTDNGYNKKKVVFIPVSDWDNDPNTKMWMYNKDINPISLLYRLMVKKFYLLKDTFDDTDFVFINDNAYFKINFSTFKESDKPKFLALISKLRNNIDIKDEGDEPTDSKKAIIDTIIDNIEDSENIKISHLTGKVSEKQKPPKSKKSSSDISEDKTGKEKASSDTEKENIIRTVKQVANNSNTVEDAMDTLNDDEFFKKILMDLNTESESKNGAEINNARRSRMKQLDNQLMYKEIKGKTVQQILDEKKELNSKDLEVTALPIDSINKEWQELTYINANKMYDPADDIVAMIYSFHNKSYPVSVRDISVEDTSTSEDYLYTYTVDYETHTGKRFKLKFDVPKIKNGQYMVLRGNKKVISSQSFLKPVLKSDSDAAQIVSNYSKIFIYRFGNSTGKSNVFADKIIKTLKKNNFNNIKVVTGDNRKICDMYDLPIDYIDIAGEFTTITTSQYEFYFNQKTIREKYGDIIELYNGIPFAFNKNTKTIIYYDASYGRFFSEVLKDLLSSDNNFVEAYNKASKSTRYTYSKASILSTEIPVVVLASYSEGLTSVLKKAGIAYKLMEKKRSITGCEDIIKFNDGFLVYENTPESSMLMNGLKECNTEAYSIKDINSRNMYLDFLDNYGGRIKADGIDNFYDCMIDPITEDVLEHYKLPNDYVSLLIYASNLMIDNKYYKHGDQEPRRIRRNEIIAGYTYKALSQSYGKYAIDMRHGRDSIMTMKQSSIIDLILLDPSSGDSSFLNPLAEAESYNTVTTKGLSGMNSDRSYSVDKRSYDESMINVLGMSTNFAGTVGINRQATINSNISTVRGYVSPSSKDDMNSVNTLCISEALTPMGTTRDDPFRTAMTFVQTSKHSMRVSHSDPCLITNGASAALPYLISDQFAHKAKEDGEVTEFVDNEYMIISYNDGTADYVKLSDSIEKNSASGFYQVVKLDTNLKLGSKVKKNDIVAYDHLSFSNKNGMNNDLEYNIGTLVKCAMLDTDEGFEDSAIISKDLSEAMASDVVVKKEINLAKETTVYKLLEPGTHVEEGDIIATIQTPYDEEDANALLKTLVDDPEEISNLGRINITSKVTGIIQDIEIYRTVELDELSDSLKKICKKYEKKIKNKKDMMIKYGIDRLEELPPDYKLESTGKLKNCIDGVQIIFYLKYSDKMSVGETLQ